MTRSIRDVAYKALQAKEKILTTTSKDASISEIAKETGISEIDIADAMDAISEPISIYDSIFHDNDDSLQLIDQIKDTSCDDKIIEKTILKDALNSLSKREQQILFMRYYVGKTQMEVSQEVGISQAQVSRLEKNALKSIKVTDYLCVL